MNTFIKCASVLRVGFTAWNTKKRRLFLRHVLEEHSKINIHFEEILGI